MLDKVSVCVTENVVESGRECWREWERMGKRVRENVGESKKECERVRENKGESERECGRE